MSTVEDLVKFADVLAGVNSLFIAPASKAIGIGVEAVKEFAGVYPPQPSRTRAKSFNTYVRGVGQYPRSAFMEAPVAGGYKVKKKFTGNIRYTSQHLGEKFETKVVPSADKVEGMVRNNASYSGHVLGWHSDDPKQAPYHAESGWHSADEDIEKVRPVLEKAMNEAIDEVLRKLAA
jgi:hypothetical protein